MKNTTWIFRLLIICLLTAACTRENKNPELIDPIYSDLQKELGAAQAQLEDAKKKLVEAQKNFEKSQPRSIERRSTRDEVTKFTAAVTRTEEMVEYYKIRLARRLAESRYNYKQAFHKKLPWPDPKEFEYYKINKKLRMAPLNWSQHLSSLAEESKIPVSPSNNDKKSE